MTYIFFKVSAIMRYQLPLSHVSTWLPSLCPVLCTVQ